MKDLSPTEVLTAPVRLAFPSLFTPAKPFQEGGKPKFSVVALLPPDYELDALRDAVTYAATDKWGSKGVNSRLKVPFRDALEKVNVEGFEDGWTFFNTATLHRPQVVDQQLRPIEDESSIFGGCWAKLFLRAYAWEAPGRKGVSFALNAVQLVRADDRIGGSAPAKDIFSPIAPTKASAVTTEEEDDLPF